jgi:hypothetical protein
MLNAFAKLETIMKSKVLCRAIETVGAGRGDVSTRFWEREPFNRHV